MLVKKALNNLTIKFIYNSNGTFKCEKKGVKFEITVIISKQEEIEGCCILNKRIQGNSFLYKDLITSVFRKINE